MIEVKNINLKIGNRTLLESESLKLYDGYIHALMGVSGSGKTTLLHEIALLSRLSESEIVWNSERIDLFGDEDKSNVRRVNIGYILQNLELINENLSLKDNLDCMFSLGGKLYDDALVKEYMDKLHLNCSLDQNVETMSRGEKQRFALVMALVKEADLIVLDEPTSALDINNSHELMKCLSVIAKDYNKMIVIATHDYIVAEYANVIYKIEEKHLVLKKNEVDAVFHNKRKMNVDISKRFYKIYKKSKVKLLDFLVKLIFTIMIGALCLSPIILDTVLERQNEVLSTLASYEIFIVNTDERMPHATYDMQCDVFDDSIVSMLKEINNISDVMYYWEVDGTIALDVAEIPVILVPKYGIDQITISSSLAGKIDSNAKINSFYIDGNNSRNFTVNIEQYDINDFPKSDDFNCEVVYIPYKMMVSIMDEFSVDRSHCITVVCDDLLSIEKTIEEIEKWMEKATVSSDDIKYLDQIKLLDSLEKYINVLKIVMVVGLGIVSIFVNYMINRSRQKEIATLRINGINEGLFYKLSFNENITHIAITLISVVLGYILLISLSKEIIVLTELIVVVLECFVYIVLIKILPILIFAKKTFKNDISSILRK